MNLYNKDHKYNSNNTGKKDFCKNFGKDGFLKKI